MSDYRGQTIVVTGATGKQGGAVARHLLSGGWRVRAITRDLSKPEVRALHDLGCEVVRGDLTDRSTLDRILRDAYGVFSVQTWWEEGCDAEVKQGRTVADACQSAGIKHLVYSSVVGADLRTGVPHFESKWTVEQHIRSLSVPWTILRPVFFMDNYNSPDFRKTLSEGTLSQLFRPDRRIPMIAVDDIGAFAALAFADRGNFIGKVLTLAGDELTMPQAAACFSRVLGRPVTYQQASIEEVRRYSPELATMFEWFNGHSLEVNIPACRVMYPPLLTFETFLVKTGWEKLLVEHPEEYAYIPML